MSTQSNAMSESFQSQSIAPAAIPATRLFTGRCAVNCGRTVLSTSRRWPWLRVALFAFSLSSIVGIWAKAR